MANYEKSCGAVIFSINGGKTEYLLIFNKKGDAIGHWGFAKGHTENGETEKETALREIKEETGLDVTLTGTFKAHSRYSPKVGVIKDVMYFLAEYSEGDITIQASEVADYAWLEFSEAYNRITKNADKSILYKANEYIRKALQKN